MSCTSSEACVEMQELCFVTVSGPGWSQVISLSIKIVVLVQLKWKCFRHRNNIKLVDIVSGEWVWALPCLILVPGKRNLSDEPEWDHQYMTK